MMSENKQIFDIKYNQELMDLEEKAGGILAISPEKLKQLKISRNKQQQQKDSNANS